MYMEYKIKINEFEGPMDLLLHLIKEANIDIRDISIEEITDQYLEYIRAMEDLNLDIASEYLVMASTLIEMKSNTLLPKTVEMEDSDYEPETKEGLIEKLILYKQYKEVSEDLKELESSRKYLYSKEESDLRIFQNNVEIIDEPKDINILIDAFNNFLKRQEESAPLDTKITKREYSVSVRSSEIKSILQKKGKVLFDELFDIITREYIVVTFLAILELSKQQQIDIKQENNFQEIYILKKGSD